MTVDGEAFNEGVASQELLRARMVSVQERSRALIERAVVNIDLSAARMGETLALRAESEQLRVELRKAVTEYVLVLKAMDVQPERMLVLVKTLMDTPTRSPELTARDLRDDLIRTAIEAYYAA